MRIRRDQARRLSEMAGDRQRWLDRIVARLTKLGYVPDDELLAAAMHAADAMARLRMTAYYDSVPDGVGRAETT